MFLSAMLQSISLRVGGVVDSLVGIRGEVTLNLGRCTSC
jgi:hypothetical protein